ncbi:symmetrical bis(5'-nucleosyl)-tetraphosphatase [Thiomicrospira microaerophila]|uniref:symmetrical bis(5'-nucleosyl)-tetraphosphatase n=1 Tax=Thiomicrospira microaerophila TaxID=406020 RepID=UPI0005C8F003|nr:symmetrical bis(5'-nucleosyl)-tetraphosphatase [Thiomicrospira microaerophila]
MATYVIGDLQGCFDPLQTLLTQINYQPEQDTLWFVGDIVNRGPQSLECLRFVKSLGEKGQIVLGNHDFHLIACALGLEKYRSKADTIDPILNAPDCDELIDWLRQQPLMVKHPSFAAVMVHAGIPPQWSINEAMQHAQEVEQILGGAEWKIFIKQHLFGSKTREWVPLIKGWERMRYIVNAFARMRYCDPQGKLDFEKKGAPSSSASGRYQPWFVHPNRRNKDHQIFFGHWSTLGALDGYQVHSTDTGCLWGGLLTAYCLETQHRHTLQCPQTAKPKKNSKTTPSKS